MTHRLATNYAKNYCNRTPIVKVIVENVVTCFFWGHGVHCSRPMLYFKDTTSLFIPHMYHFAFETLGIDGIANFTEHEDNDKV